MVLSDLDRVVLVLLAEHRVVTTQQLAAATDTPERTVQYRLDRLRRARLVARARPYRQSGSAPHHHFLTPHGAALVGDPSPKEPEQEPSGWFLEHTALVAGWWLALKTSGPRVGIELRSWAREEAGWEEWRPGRRARRIAPDAAATVEVADRWVDVFVEVDRATMTTRRLLEKASRYRDYARDRVWDGTHAHCPVVVLATTSERRARGFLARLEARRGPSLAAWPTAGAMERLTIAVGWSVEDPDAAVTEAVWVTESEQGPCRLVEVLTDEAEHHAAIEAAAARRAAEAAAAQARRELASAVENVSRHVGELGEALRDRQAADALVVVVGQTGAHAAGDLEERVRRVEGLYRALAAWRDRGLNEPPPADAVEYLRRAYPRILAGQIEVVLAARTHTDAGDPRLVPVAARLLDGRLIEPRALGFLDAEPHRCDDERGCAHTRYRSWRDRTAQARWRQLGFLARRRIRPEDLATQIDKEALLGCGRCGHAAWRNDPRTRRTRQAGERCLLACDGHLVAWEDRPDLPHLDTTLTALRQGRAT